jgi:hypothetical protein
MRILTGGCCGDVLSAVPPDPATTLGIPPSFRLDLYPSGFVLRKPPAANAALQPGSAAALQAQRDGVLHPYDRSTRPFLQVTPPARDSFGGPVRRVTRTGTRTEPLFLPTQVKGQRVLHF